MRPPPGALGDAGEPASGGSPASLRWELLWALGALVLDGSGASPALCDSLGLRPWTGAEHTEIFVLNLPPYASIHLGVDGKLGGSAAGRLAGLWRSLSLDVPKECDHLGVVLGLYARLGVAADQCRTRAATNRLRHVQRVVFWEHIWTWLPGYLAAVGSHSAGRAWAALAGRVLVEEARATEGPSSLPGALRDAPPPLCTNVAAADLLDALTAPLRVGFILTRTDLIHAGSALGLGVRSGERRYVLAAMFDQDPEGVLRWLGAHARRWADLHEVQVGSDETITGWWRRRAITTATTLERLARQTV